MELVQVIIYSLQIFIVTLFTLVLSAFAAYRFKNKGRKQRNVKLINNKTMKNMITVSNDETRRESSYKKNRIYSRR